MEAVSVVVSPPGVNGRQVDKHAPDTYVLTA